MFLKDENLLLINFLRNNKMKQQNHTTIKQTDRTIIKKSKEKSNQLEHNNVQTIYVSFLLLRLPQQRRDASKATAFAVKGRKAARVESAHHR